MQPSYIMGFDPSLLKLAKFFVVVVVLKEINLSRPGAPRERKYFCQGKYVTDDGS